MKKAKLQTSGNSQTGRLTQPFPPIQRSSRELYIPYDSKSSMIPVWSLTGFGCLPVIWRLDSMSWISISTYLSKGRSLSRIGLRSRVWNRFVGCCSQDLRLSSRDQQRMCILLQGSRRGPPQSSAEVSMHNG